MLNKYNFIFLRRIITMLFFSVLAVLPLMADKKSDNPLPEKNLIPNVPEFSITYQGEELICSPTGLIKTKTHKDLVAYECQKKYVNESIEKIPHAERGLAETRRLSKDIKTR